MTPTAFSKTVFATALLAAAFAGPALARGETFTAKLATPVAATTQVIASNAVWTCEGDTCVAAPNHGVSVRACRQFVREAGPVTAYGPANAPLSAEELARCNGDSAQQQAHNN